MLESLIKIEIWDGAAPAVSQYQPCNSDIIIHRRGGEAHGSSHDKSTYWL